ncbi:MAG: transposase [Bryobacteraceae bacterium]
MILVAQKSWSVEEKLRIVLTGMTKDVSISELCRREGVTETTYYRWRDAFLEGGRSALGGNGPTNREKQLERENEQLKQALGEQMLANRLLKKIHGAD